MPFFQGSQGTSVKDTTQIDVNGSHNSIHVGANDKRRREGIELLLRFCVPEAIHDSSARGDLGCHPGTRKEYIRNITSWGKGEWDSKDKRVFLMTGPAGAGKSAIARTCAHKMKESGNLSASFFFYRPNGWNEPMKFIPTIVYQLTTRHPAFRDLIDAIILDDRLVLEKAMDIQFRELLVKPLRKLADDDHEVKDTVIIVDGLDECATVEAQMEIISLVTTSILEQTTPFLWAFFSRPEPPITSAFSLDAVANVSWKLPLTLSGNADSDIEAYIRGSFETIRAKYSIPPDVTWPKEGDIRRLVSQSAGLFIYPATALRYIGKGTSGLEERLRLVLQLDAISTENPFLVLDQLYLLIMQQIPEGILFDTMSLLFLYQGSRTSQFSFCGTPQTIHEYHSTLGLSSAAFYAAISNLYSVLEVTKSLSGTPVELKFYHKSFIDFLFDESRSRRYFLQSPSAVQCCAKKLVQHMAGMAVTDSGEPTNIWSFVAGLTWFLRFGGEVDKDSIHFFAMQLFFTAVEELDGKLSDDVLLQMSQLNWRYWSLPGNLGYRLEMKKFIQKIPTDWRRRIIRPYRKGLSGIRLQILASMDPEKYSANAYIIGEGNKKALMVRGGETYEIRHNR